MCALALKNFAVQLKTAKPYIDNDSQRPARKQRYIRAHIEQTYFANLDYFFMMRFMGYDAALNLRLKLPFEYEDGASTMITMAPYKKVGELAPAIAKHHSDSLGGAAEGFYYFLEETRIP